MKLHLPLLIVAPIVRLPLVIAAAAVLSAACGSMINSEPRIDFLGKPAPATAAMRSIVLTPDTKWVNVTGGETVRFIVGDKAFAWNFDVAEAVSRFDLNRIAPAGMLNREVVAYVSPNPLYMGDGGHHRDHGDHGGHSGGRK